MSQCDFTYSTLLSPEQHKKSGELKNPLLTSSSSPFVLTMCQLPLFLAISNGYLLIWATIYPLLLANYFNHLLL